MNYRRRKPSQLGEDVLTTDATMQELEGEGGAGWVGCAFVEALVRVGEVGEDVVGYDI